MKDQLLKLFLSAYWIGRRYEEHKALFGKENADSKAELMNGEKAKEYFEKQIDKLKISQQCL